MDTEIEVVELEALPTLEISRRAATWQLPKVIGGGLKRIAEYLATQGMEPAGPPYVRYLGLDFDTLVRENPVRSFFLFFTRKWDVLVGVPVGGPMPGTDNIVPGTLPAGQALRTLHRGPYRKVGDAYNRLQAEIARQGHAVGNQVMESYLNDPRAVRPADLETVIIIPLAQ